MSNTDGGNGADDVAMRARLAALSKDLGARKVAAPPVVDDTAGGANSLGGAMSLGFRVMSEFVAAVVVSALLGWQADRWLGTSPALLIIFVALGTAAGFWTVYRTATRPTGVAGRR